MSINRFCAGWDIYSRVSGGEQATEQDGKIYDHGLSEESSRPFSIDGDAQNQSGDHLEFPNRIARQNCEIARRGHKDSETLNALRVSATFYLPASLVAVS